MLDVIYVRCVEDVNKNRKKFTWRTLNPVRKQAKLDFYLVSETFFQYVTEADIIARYRTDHNGITLQLELTEKKRGKGNWEFNNSLLKDIDHASIVKKTIAEVKETFK